MTMEFPLSPRLRLLARAISEQEACWNWRDIIPVLTEVANRNGVILGFDILSFDQPKDAVHLWGTSTYEMKEYLNSAPWSDCVNKSLNAALEDIRRTRDITAYTGKLENLWYSPVIMQSHEPLYPRFKSR